MISRQILKQYELAFRVLRVWYNGRTSAFQADDASSILATRSIFADIAQVVERILGKDEVPSSTLGISTIYTKSRQES